MGESEGSTHRGPQRICRWELRGAEAKGFELDEMKSSLANSNKNLTKLESENKDLTKNLSLVMQEKLKMEEELQEKVLFYRNVTRLCILECL